MLKVRVVVLMPEDGSIAVKAGYPPEDMLDGGGLAAAQWAGRATGRRGGGRIRCPAQSGCSCPCAPAAALIGVVGIDSDKPGPLLTPDQRRCSTADGPGGGRDRARPPGRGCGPGQTGRRDRSSALRAADLDLPRSQDAARFGLGAACTSAISKRKLSESEKADLLATIIDESERLNRFIANLLDMTRLESGAVTAESGPA